MMNLDGNSVKVAKLPTKHHRAQNVSEQQKSTTKLNEIFVSVYLSPVDRCVA